MKYSGQGSGWHTLETQARYVASFDQVHRHYWEIAHQHDDYWFPIGTINAYRTEQHQTANIGLLISRNQWGRGYGREAWQAVMDWLFSDGIRKCEAGAYSRNLGMLNIFHKTGMAVEGKRRSSIKCEDGWCDIIEVGKFNDRSHKRTGSETVGSEAGHGSDSVKDATAGSERRAHVA